jgi:hypothetical protein
MTLQDIFKQAYGKAKDIDIGPGKIVNSARSSLNSFSSRLEKRRKAAAEAKEGKSEEAQKEEKAAPKEEEKPKDEAQAKDQKPKEEAQAKDESVKEEQPKSEEAQAEGSAETVSDKEEKKGPVKSSRA